MAGDVFRSAADRTGAYEIKGPSHLTAVGVALAVLVTAPGHSPAWAWCRVSGTGRAQDERGYMRQEPIGLDQAMAWLKGVLQSRSPDCVSDIVLPTSSDGVANVLLPTRPAALEVVVRRDDGPRAGVPVTAYLEDEELTPFLPFRPENDHVKQLADTLSPIVMTGQDGVARFKHLLPGRYHVRVADADLCKRVEDCGNPSPREIWGAADGVPVFEGVSRVEVGFSKRAARGAFRVVEAAAVKSSRNLDVESDRGGPTGWDAQVGSAGVVQLGLSPLGLWPFTVKVGSGNWEFVPGKAYAAEVGVVGVSPNLGNFVSPLTMRQIGQASARITVLDAAGKPALAEVQLGIRGSLKPPERKETDPDGTVLFTGLMPDSGMVHVSLPDVPAVDLGDCTTRLSPAEALRGRVEVLDRQTALPSGREAALVMRAQPIGYIHGKLRQPAGQDAAAAHTNMLLSDQASLQGARLRHCPSTGEFLAGPFAAGIVHLGAVNGYPGFGLPETSAATEVEPGQVTELELIAPPIVPEQLGADGQVMNILPGGPRLMGHVFLADGVTPAWAARVLYYHPDYEEPVAFALTNARGETQMQSVVGRGLPSNFGGVAPPLAAPVVAALIPGSTGVAIVPAPAMPGDVLRIVLPAPLSTHGQVTIGGVAPVSRPGAIRVLAGYQGRGALDRLLSLDVTADPEGKFVLSGLTPGRYLVQATLDNIWLSPAVSMEVGSTDPAPPTLDISAPGAPIMLHLIDKTGHPVIGAAVDVERPTGPLADRLPAVQWISNSEGLIAFPTLETGRHLVHSVDDGTTLAIDVPALPAPLVESTMMLAARSVRQ
jgi:hypothetical protein